MRYLVLLICILLVRTANSQYIIGEYPTTISANDIEVASDGGYYLAGSDWLSSSQKGVVAKYDSTGTLLWKSKWGTSETHVNDITITEDNRLFGVSVSDEPEYEMVFELDVQTGDTIWTSPIESAKYIAPYSSFFAELWLDNGHVMVKVAHSILPEVIKVYCFSSNDGEKQWEQTYTTDYGGPDPVDYNKSELYPLPMYGFESDSQVVYSYTGIHDTIPMSISKRVLHILPNGDEIAIFGYANASLQYYKSNGELAYSRYIYKDNPELPDVYEASVYSTAVFDDNILISCSVWSSDQGGSILHSLFEYETGAFVWDTLINKDSTQLSLSRIDHNNGYLYAYGGYNTNINVWRLNLNQINKPSAIEEQKKESGYHIYPNPANSTLFVNFNQQQQATISLYSLTGALVLQKQVNATEAQLDVSSLPVGVYVLEAQTKNGIETQKVVIEK